MIKKVFYLQNLNYKTQKLLILFGFLTIPVLLLTTFNLYPATRLLVYSFTDWDGLSHHFNWVGFDNYKDVFSDKETFAALSHNLYYFVGAIVQNILALYFAVILNTKIRGRNIFRLVLFAPYILNGVAISFMFLFFFKTDGGTLNSLLHWIGLSNWEQSWLGNPKLINISLSFVSLWRYMGLGMVIYLGVLQSISADLYEAAKIDGANAMQSFRYITLPSIRKVIELNMLLAVAGALEVFDIPFVMTGAASGSDTFVTRVVDIAFKFQSFGLASAMSVALIVIVVIVIAIQRKLILGRGERD
jgi:raffinose/stachyose/melibiose transport system permease protein